MRLSRTKIWPNILRSVLVMILIAGVPPRPGFAQVLPVLDLPEPGTMVNVSGTYHPAVLKGLTVHPDKPFSFDFIIDTGDTAFDQDALQTEADKLIKYFLAALTVPERQLWVNLSPYEKDRIIPLTFGETEMGRDLLAQDYLLKQLTASLIYPESELGGQFWQRVYARTRECFGSVEIPVDTFNKIWIVPETAELFVSGQNVFVVESRLKVMLEEDYVALSQNAGHQEHGLGNMTPDKLSPTAGLSAQIVREIILPEIEREVNDGKNFANLRQIFHSLILAAWYKQNLKDSAFARSYVDLGKTDGIAVDDPRINQKIYDRYVTAYKKGVYNYIREDYDALTASTIPRKYFSGGVEADVTPVLQVSRSGEKFGRSIKGELVTAETYARATHTLWHQQGAFSPVIDDIAAELGLSSTGYDYPLTREVRARGGSITLKNGGRMELTSDGILLIIDPRFAADHAGRGAHQLAVYARNDVKARHELAELRFLIQAAREQGILLATDRSDRLSQRLREWANAITINDAERLARQNQLIVLADQAHRRGLIAEGRISTARAMAEPELLTRPVSDFDITVASDGAAAVKVYSYLKYLDNEGYTPFVLTLTKVIAAVVQDRPSYLIKPDQLTPQVIQAAFTRLGQFRADKVDTVVMQAPGMSSEEINLYRDAGKILKMILGKKDEHTMGEAVAQLQRNYPDQFENPLADVPRALLNRRLQQLGLVQRRFHKGELAEVISFGDKHGRTEDLGKILERAREAARSGERLTIIGHGDGFDRGSDNVGVYTMFRELKELEKAHANITVKLLYGNHDVWLLEAMMAIERRDWDVWENNGGDATLQELYKRDGNMFQLMRFMLENFDLYYVDEWEMLHIHGGFAVNSLGEPQLAATKLQALQSRLEEFRQGLAWTGDRPLTEEEKRAIWELMHDMEEVVTISRQTWDARFRNIRINIDQKNLDRMYDVAKRHILRLPGEEEPTEAELRAFFDEKWQELLLTSPDMFYTLGIDFEFDDSDRDEFLVNRMDRFMARMGVLGVVNGHHHHNRIYSADLRVFGVDTDDDDAGHMVMNARGVEYVSVERPQVDVIANSADLTTKWEQQKRRIYEQYSQRSLKRLLNAGKLKPASGEDAAMLADWDWQQIQMQNVNPVFDRWVGSGQMDTEDLKILREILSGDAQVLAKLLEERPDKVGVKAEDREKPDKNGRMVYLRLGRPLTTEAGDITVLRIKGARPRFKDGVRELESHTGDGFDSSPVEVNRYGQPYVKLPAIDLVTLDIKPEVQNPQGAQLLEKARQEYRLMQLGQKGAGFTTDIPLAVGQWKNATHDGRPVGFVIAGMRAEDVRLNVDGLVDPQKLVVSVETEIRDAVDENAAREIYRQIGASLRAYHDAGYFHRYPHQRNLGIEWDNAGRVRVILRDLDTTVQRDEIESVDPAKSEATYRMLDLQRVVADLSTANLARRMLPQAEVNRHVRPYVEQLLRGYFPELDVQPEKFRGMVDSLAGPGFSSYVRNLYQEEARLPLQLNPYVQGVWQKLMSLSDAAILADTAAADLQGLARNYPQLERFKNFNEAKTFISAWLGKGGRFAKERVSVVALDDQNKAVVIGGLDRKLVNDLKLRYLSVSVFVNTPGGENYVMLRRAAFKSAEPKKLAPAGGYATFGLTAEAAALQELREELMFPEGYELDPRRLRRVKVMKVDDAPVPELAMIFEYDARPQDMKIIKGNIEQINTEKRGMSQPEYEDLKVRQNKERPGTVDAYGIYVVPKKDVRAGGEVELTDRFMETYGLNAIETVTERAGFSLPARLFTRADQTGVFNLKTFVLKYAQDEAQLVVRDDDGFTPWDKDRYADAARELVLQIERRGIRRILFSGTSAFLTKELVTASWIAIHGNADSLPPMHVIPNPGGNKAYMMWQPGGLTKTLETVIPNVSKTALRAEMRGGHVALLDDHIGSGAKMKTFHRLFTTEYGATPVIGALVAIRPRLKHIGPMEEFGEFEVVAGVLDASLVEKMSDYATGMRDTWLKTRPYQEGSAIADPFVEAVRARINRSDEAMLNNPGGIDLNPAGLKMTVSGDAAPLISSPPTGLMTVPEVDGYVPVILNISPTTNLPLLLGQDNVPAPPTLAAVRAPSARP